LLQKPAGSPTTPEHQLLIKEDIDMTVEKSFIAELASDKGHLHFPRLTHGREVTMPTRGLFDFTPTHLYVSDILFAKSDLPRATLQFCFRHIGVGFLYYMYVVTPGPLFGRLIVIDENNCLTAMAGPNAGPKQIATFHFLDKNGNLASLDDPRSNTLSVTVHVNGGSLNRRKNTDEGFILHAGGGIRMNFILKIIKRNVDWKLVIG
jgi:hypothetical protein